MLSQSLLHQFVARIHESVIVTEPPYALIQDLAKELDGALIAVSRFHRLPGDAGEQFSSRPVGVFEALYHELSMELPWADVMTGECSGEFFAVRDHYSEDEIRATRYFREWMQPQGFAPLAVMGSFVPATHDAPGCGWALYRDRDFESDEVEFCRVLDTHLTSATRTAWHLRMVEGTRDAALEVLDSGIEGILLINPNGIVTWLNRRAKHVLSQEPGLRIVAGRLAGLAPGVDAELTSAVSFATARNERGKRVGHASIVSVARDGDQLPLGVAVVPVGRPLPDLLGEEPAAVAFVIDSNTVRRPPLGVLQALYNLTTAEARLARALAGGQTLAEFAEASGRSHETVRTQLKFLFRKLNVSRQSDLIRLLAASPAPHGED